MYRKRRNYLHDPQLPWSLTAVTESVVVQSTESAAFTPSKAFTILVPSVLGAGVDKYLASNSAKDKCENSLCPRV